jgi:hypothetical protein
MGLGKTAQSISVLAYQKQYGGIRGPFLGGRSLEQLLCCATRWQHLPFPPRHAKACAITCLFSLTPLQSLRR